MTSGFSRFGGTGPCYRFWMTFQGCMENVSSVREKDQCQPAFDDYFECLHHKKERAQAMEVLQKLNDNAKKEKELKDLQGSKGSDPHKSDTHK